MIFFSKKMGLLVIKTPFGGDKETPNTSVNPKKKQLGVFKINVTPPVIYF